MKVCVLCHSIPTRYIVAGALLVGLGGGIIIGSGLTAFQMEMYKSTMKGILNQAVNQLGHAAQKGGRKR